MMAKDIFGIGNNALVTDSVVLPKDEVARATARPAAEPEQGDILSALKIGLALSSVLWAAIIVAGFLIFQ